jgi:cystathionine beta-lyase/cystathionine gamma-synthase
VVVSRNVYGGTFRYFTQVLSRHGLEFSWVDTTRPAAIREAWRESTRMLFVETPTNPMMEITDLAAAARIARQHEALFVVDNTFLSPYLQRPLELGADVVVHSTTKYLNGHSDSLGGVLVTSREEIGEWLAFVQKSSGGVMAPFDAFLVLRGIKTLPVRMDRHETNARALAALLDAHPNVGRVFYPGLSDHPGHDVQKAQARGFGAMLSFDAGSYDAAKRVLDRFAVMSLAESLGGVESLVCHPATMTHASVPEERRLALGIGDGLIRISAGIEGEADLVHDLERALDAL